MLGALGVDVADSDMMEILKGLTQDGMEIDVGQDDKYFTGFDGSNLNVLDYQSQPALAADWQDIEFDAALDSGCVEHVCDSADVQGYEIEASHGSRAGQGFIVGNGNTIPNIGQATLNLVTDQNGEETKITPCFQIAKVTRPLMSVSKVCDHGYRCLFDKDKAIVMDQSGKTMCTYLCRGGLYVCRLRLKAPASFRRQGKS